MRIDRFFDTNVLVYALSEDDRRARLAWTLLEEGGCVSVQVLNEFVAVTRKKFKLPWRAIIASLDVFRDCCGEPLSLNETAQRRAVEISRDHQYHIYDATIIASAILSGAGILFSEDMADGQFFDGRLQILNPFIVS